MSDVWVKFSREELDELLSPHTILFAPPRDKVRRQVGDKLSMASQEVHDVLGDSFVDDRGKIQDLITGPIDSVTMIRTVQGAVRGNHFHDKTIQWTYILSGCLQVSHAGQERIALAGEMVVEEPGVPHAWKAVADTVCLVFTRGPRSGTGYEDDTTRLDEPLLS